MLFPEIAVPKGHASAVDVTSLRPSDKSALEAFQDFRPIILRQGPPHLKEEPPLGSLLHRVGHDQELHAGPFKLLGQ
jgi:hypothetical protein